MQRRYKKPANPPGGTARKAALRRAGVPLSRAHFMAEERNRRPRIALLTAIVIAVSYIGLAGAWALWQLDDPAHGIQAAQASDPAQTPASDAPPFETASAPTLEDRIAQAAAQASQRATEERRAAEAAVEAAEARLRETETRLTEMQATLDARTSAPPAAPADTQAQTADCVPGLASMAQRLRVDFDAGQTRPDPRVMAGVAVLSEAAQLCPEAAILVEGHTDRSGEEGLNLRLSWERAENVIDWLETRGHDTTSFTAMGYGSRLPASEGDASGAPDLAIDRRVQFTVIRRALAPAD